MVLSVAVVVPVGGGLVVKCVMWFVIWEKEEVEGRRREGRSEGRLGSRAAVRLVESSMEEAREARKVGVGPGVRRVECAR